MNAKQIDLRFVRGDVSVVFADMRAGDDGRELTGTARAAANDLAPGSISIKGQAGEVARCRPETWF